MKATRSLLCALFASLVLAAPIAAQEAPSPDALPVEELAMQAGEEADRAALRAFLGRDAVQTAARIGGVDLDAATAAVATMEGDRLANAAQQARVIDQQLTAQDVITLRATTIIIILLLLIIIVIAA